MLRVNHQPPFSNNSCRQYGIYSPSKSIIMRWVMNFQQTGSFNDLTRSIWPGVSELTLDNVQFAFQSGRSPSAGGVRASNDIPKRWGTTYWSNHVWEIVASHLPGSWLQHDGLIVCHHSLISPHWIISFGNTSRIISIKPLYKIFDGYLCREKCDTVSNTGRTHVEV